MIRYVFSLVFIALIVAGSSVLFFPDYWVHRYDELIARHARVYRLDEKLVWSLIYEETYFRAWKIGAADEVGLMQVTPLVAREWARETGLKEIEKQATDNIRPFLSDPERNIQVGCWYLEKLREPSFKVEPPAFHLHTWFSGEGFGSVVTHQVPIGNFDGPHPFFGPDGKLL